MQDDADPPRKFYTMKAREIERLNAPPGQPTKSGEIKVQDHFKEIPNTHRRPTDPPRTPAPTASIPAANDVAALVQANAIKEHAAGLNDIALGRPPAPSRRRRDYLTVIILGNLCILGATAAVGFSSISVLFGISASVVFSVTVSWIIWVVMDKY